AAVLDIAYRLKDFNRYSLMAPAELATILAVAVVACAFASASAAAAQSCGEQIKYFTNCLARDEIRQQCCVVIQNANCLCQLKREVAVPCISHRRHGHHCPVNVAPLAVHMAELKRLPCFKGLKCLRA
ncbi:hypothetical protein BS78_K136600, partial [Paspalum vaginatum]